MTAIAHRSDKDDLVRWFKYLGVNVELVQYRDGKPPRVQIAYEDAKEFMASMVEMSGERSDLRRRLDAANESGERSDLRRRLDAANERLARRGDTTTHRLDPEQLERLGEILNGSPTERERELQTRVEHLETEANRLRGPNPY